MKQVIVNRVIHTEEECCSIVLLLSKTALSFRLKKECQMIFQTIYQKGKLIASSFIDSQIYGGQIHYFGQSQTEDTIQDIYISSLK